MRIPGNSLSKTGSKRSESTRGASKENQAQGAAPVSGGPEDSVAIGSQNALVAQAMQSESLARSERVHQLKSALEAGSYHADAAEVSKAMVAEAVARATDNI